MGKDISGVKTMLHSTVKDRTFNTEANYEVNFGVKKFIMEAYISDIIVLRHVKILVLQTWYTSEMQLGIKALEKPKSSNDICML